MRTPWNQQERRTSRSHDHHHDQDQHQREQKEEQDNGHCPRERHGTEVQAKTRERSGDTVRSLAASMRKDYMRTLSASMDLEQSDKEMLVLGMATLQGSEDNSNFNSMTSTTSTKRSSIGGTLFRAGGHHEAPCGGGC